MRIQIKSGSGPVNPAITKEDVKQFGFINSDERDDDIDSLISAATIMTEKLTGRKLITQTWYIYYDQEEFADRLRTYKNQIVLTTFNVQSIVELLVYKKDNTSSTITASNYRQVGDELTSNTRLAFNDDYNLNLSDVRNTDSYRVEVVVGYGLLQTDIPSPLRDSLRMIINHWVQFPNKVSESQVFETPTNYNAAIFSYRSTEAYF